MLNALQCSQHRGLVSIARAGVLSLALLAWSGCNDTQAPQETDSAETEYGGTYDPVDGVLEFRVESLDGAETALRLVASEIQWAPGSGILRAQVALYNSGSESVPGPDGVMVFDFDPPDVRPLNAVCQPFDPPSPLPNVLCVFDHRGTYGEDGVLAAGETSEPVEWQLQNTAGVSFAFRARLSMAPPAEGTISGVVFDDRNQNGEREADEPGVEGVGIALELDDFVLIRRTNARGQYAFDVDRPGLYRLRKTVPEGWIPTTPTELQVLIIVGPDGALVPFTHADFGCFRAGTSDLSIVGNVFHDLNRNGIRELDEPGIPGVSVTAEGVLCLSPIGAATRSDSSGFYMLSGTDVRCDLPWFVQRGPVEGMIGTTSTHVLLNQPPSDGNTFRVDFGLAEPDLSQPRIWLSLEGVVFNDANGNAVRDANEAPVPRAQVQLVSVCEVLRMTYTDSDGVYRFEPFETQICPVTAVWLSHPRFKDVTTPNPFPLPPVLAPGFHLIQVDFGVRTN